MRHAANHERARRVVVPGCLQSADPRALGESPAETRERRLTAVFDQECTRAGLRGGLDQVGQVRHALQRLHPCRENLGVLDRVHFDAEHVFQAPGDVIVGRVLSRRRKALGLEERLCEVAVGLVHAHQEVPARDRLLSKGDLAQRPVHFDVVLVEQPEEVLERTRVPLLRRNMECVRLLARALGQRVRALLPEVEE